MLASVPLSVPELPVNEVPVVGLAECADDVEGFSGK